MPKQKDATEVQDEQLIESTVENGKTEVSTSKKKQRRVSLDPSTLVPCVSNINAPLIYNSPSTHRTWEWAYIGDMQHLELSELQTMKGRSPKFFSDKLITIDDPEIVEYLRIGHFYKNAIDEDDIEQFFDMDIDEMERFLDKISVFERTNIIDKVRERYDSGEFDSSRKIEFLEKKYNIAIRV